MFIMIEESVIIHQASTLNSIFLLSHYNVGGQVSLWADSTYQNSS